MKPVIEIQIPKYAAYKNGKLAGFFFSIKQLEETLNEKSVKIKDHIEKKSMTKQGYFVFAIDEEVRNTLKKYKSNIESEGLRKTDLFIEFIKERQTPNKDLILLFLNNIKKSASALAKTQF